MHETVVDKDYFGDRLRLMFDYKTISENNRKSSRVTDGWTNGGVVFL